MTRTIARSIALAALAAGAGWAQQLTLNCTPTTLPTTVGMVVSVTCAPTGTGPWAWSISAGLLPPGLTQDSTTGNITGTLGSPAGSYSFTVMATDSTSASGTQVYSGTTVDFTVTCTLSTGPPEVGVLYSNSCTAAGGTPPYNWSITGVAVPPLMGGTITATGDPATISYTPGSAAAAYQYQYRVVAADSSAPPFTTKSAQFAGTIAPAVTITALPLPPGAVGSTYSPQQFAAAGGVSPYAWTATGLAGTGLSMSATGSLSGAPTTAGPLTFTAIVTDGVGGTSSSPFTLTVTPALVISPASPLRAATVGQAYTQTFTASGGSGSGYTWSVSGQPAWLSMTSAGVLNGTPPTTAVTSTFTVTLTDSNNNSTSGSFTLPVTLSITTTTVPNGVVNVAYPSTTLQAQGGTPPYTWAISAGALPAGMTLSPAGVISGTPTMAGSFSFTAKVTDSSPTPLTATQAYSGTIAGALTIATTSPLANGTVGGAYNQALTGSGGMPPYTWSVAAGSSLPGGLKLTSSSTTGTISGTPTATGAFLFSIQLSDNATPPNTVTKQFSITIAAFTIATAPTLPNATVGIAYSQTLAAAGGAPPYSWAITKGSLPALLTLNSTSSTATITGMPAATATGTATFTVTVTDSASNTASQAFTLTVVTAPVINTTSLPNGTVGAPYSQTLAASGGTSPYNWAVASGGLPVGLSLSSGGAITGKPSAAGASSFNVQLTDATGVTASQALTLTIAAGVTISTPSPLPTGEATIAYSQTLVAAGGTSPYTWSVTGGTLPPGLTLAASGSLAGTPGTAGTVNFTVQATDSNNVTASAQLAVTIAAALGISTNAALNNGSLNTIYSQTLAASAGVGPYTWTLTAGALPAGLTLSPAGAIAGVPTVAGTSSFTAKVTDSLGATASRQFTIVIVAGLTISTPPTLPGAAVGLAYSELLQASGGTTPYTWIKSAGSLPAGLSLSTNGNLTGIPTAAGSFSFTVQVADTLGHQASEQMSITVAPALSITTSALPGGTVGAAYSQSLAATGGTPPYTWSVLKGSLPTGLTLSAAGSIAGTANAAGTSSFTVLVTDSAKVTATKQLSITVVAGLSITTAAALPNGNLNASYSQTLAAGGGTPPYTWAPTAGALPTGLTLSTAGVIAGTPTAAGTFQFTATVTDSASLTASQQFTLIVGGGLAITTTALPGGKVGASYSQTLTATGGTPPYTFATSAGSLLPPGITLTGAVLGGTPTKTGSYTFTIQVTDSVSATATQQFTILITNLAITTSAPLPGATVGTAYSQTLAAAGGTAPYTWALTGGALPAGLSLSSAGAISGTPTAAGTFQLTATVTDSAASTASQQFTLVSEISATFTGLSSTAAAAQQLSGTLALGAAYPQAITGQITLAFQPDKSLASPADDPSIQFSTGGTTAPFTIPANSTTPVSFSLQTGTVAGTITLTVSWQAGSATLPVPAALTQTIQVAPAVPVISAVTASTTSSGFQVVIKGYSNTREVSQALLQFTPASGQTLQTTSLTVSLNSAATTWFQSSTSDQYGSQFILTLPFTVTNGSASAIASISVQLVNSQGNSTSASATL